MHPLKPIVYAALAAWIVVKVFDHRLAAAASANTPVCADSDYLQQAAQRNTAQAKRPNPANSHP